MGWLADIIKATPVADKGSMTGLPEPSSYNYPPTGGMYNMSTLDEVVSDVHPGTIGVDYWTLMNVSRVPVIGAIIQTRIQQVAEFAVPQQNPYATGYRIRLRDPEAKTTSATKKRAREIMALLEDAGGVYGPGGFEPFVRMIMRDSLVYDQANFEILRTRGLAGKGRNVVGFVPVDASTIRKARPKQARGRENIGRWYPDADKKSYIQTVEDKIVNTYGAGEMSWCIRRPRTWIQTSGYGYPELEELLRVVTDLLNAQTYNSVNFTNGIHAQTILLLKSTMTANVFDAFKRHMMAMMTGVRNAKRMPIIQLAPEGNEDLKAVTLSQSNKEMEYSNWINWLLKVTCAVYTMDPAEIGFTFGNEGQSAALTSAGPAQRITASKERGLRPLLRSLQSWINTWIIKGIDEDFIFEFVGMDATTEEDRIKLDLQTVKGYKTINEIRAEHDLSKLDTPLGECVLDPTFVNTWNQIRMEEQQEQESQEEPPGEFGDYEIPPEAEEYDLAGLLEDVAKSTEEGIRQGRIDWKVDPNRVSKGGKLALVDAEPGVKAYIVEVE